MARVFARFCRRNYAQAGQGAWAMAQFEHALELDSDRGDAHDRIARVLWSQ
jgi:hypothetical protein